MIVTKRTITINRLTIVQNDHHTWQVIAPDGNLLAAFPDKAHACLYAARRREFAQASLRGQQIASPRRASGSASFLYGIMLLTGLPAGLGWALILLTLAAVFLVVVPLGAEFVRGLSNVVHAAPMPLADVVGVLAVGFLAVAALGALGALALYRFTRLDVSVTLFIVTPLYLATLLAPAVGVSGACLGLVFGALHAEGFTLWGTLLLGAGWLAAVLLLNRVFWNLRFAHNAA